MIFRDNPCFKRKPGCKWCNSKEVLIFCHTPVFRVHLLTYNITIYASLFVIIIEPCTFNLFKYMPWYNRQGNKLRVRMFERCTRSLPFVFENKNVLKPDIFFQVYHPVPVSPYNILYLPLGKG